jgi:anthranilate synthase component 1
METELKLDRKEIAEHIMLVDLARNDIARISRPGTRRVTKLLEVERYSHVMHLVSVVEGLLDDDLDALHAYAAAANMGTLVGAPKLEAARLLRRYEKDRRGPYGGAVGYLTSDGEFDSAIVIRAAQVTGGMAFIRAGAGVVFDSDPAAEAAETAAKARAVVEAVVLAGGGAA